MIIGYRTSILTRRLLQPEKKRKLLFSFGTNTVKMRGLVESVQRLCARVRF